MINKTSFIALSLIIILSVTSIQGMYEQQVNLSIFYNEQPLIPQYTISSSNQYPQAITVSDSNPFYALIATPLAIYYDISGNQQVIPLYVKNMTKPSSTIMRTEQELGIISDYVIGDIFNEKQASLIVAESFWEESTHVLLIEDSFYGYSLGVVATPIASYLHIPIIVTNDLDDEVLDTLHNLNVETLFICGGFELPVNHSYKIIQFTNVDDIIQETITIHQERFNDPIDYITIANPLDITIPTIEDSVTESYTGTVGSSIFLPSQLIGMLTNGNAKTHDFTIPQNYKYARLRIKLENLNSEDVTELGDELVFLLKSPEGINYLYDGTMGGLPLVDHQGDIIKDQIQFETIIYNKPGIYQIQVFGKWFARKSGSYNVEITIEKLDTSIVPLMEKLSTIAPYLTAYHKGILFAKPSFAFAANDTILYNGNQCPGISQPGSNPALIEPSNTHTLQIHEQLNTLLVTIANIPSGNLEQLRNHYKDNPLNIAITADPTMVPMYFYKNPDGEADNNAGYMSGFALPSDFIYADIDPRPDDIENNSYSYWPYQENIVGRVTGYDPQDASALIARTIFYNTLLERYRGWKDNALVATGCGLEFQNLPIITRLSQFLYGGRGEPTKFPTGESTFINLRIQETIRQGYLSVKGTFLTQSQREGFSDEDLNKIKRTGFLNRLFFSDKSVSFVSSDKKVTGSSDHLSSNFILCFAHGSFNLFEHGDVLLDARGFPFITTLARIYPPISSGLNTKGAFDIRSVSNMEYGPSVLFIISCITGRTDGLVPENTLSQAFLHAGANAYIGATRVTADPGYLNPRPLPGGWGIGTLGLIKATWDYVIKETYPDSHFGAVIGEDFVTHLIVSDETVGMALRNAKNQYLPKDANSTFYWTPPLMGTMLPGYITNDDMVDLTPQPQPFEETRALDKKYVAVHEFTLYGDPAFNPYQTMN